MPFTRFFAAPLLAVLLWAGNVVVTKFSAGVIAPGAMAFYRGLAAAYALYNVLLRQWQSTLPIWPSLYIQVLIGTLFLLPAFLSAPSRDISVLNAPMIFYAGTVATVLAPALWMVGVHRLGANRTSIFMNLLPVATTMLAVSVLHESVTASHLMGGGLTILGVFIAQFVAQPRTTRSHALATQKASRKGVRHMVQEARAKTAVIIGASSDLGLPITRDLLQQGFRIVAHYHSNRAHLEGLHAENLILEQADLSDDAAVAALFARAALHLGQIDVVVHLVGPYHEAEVLTYAPSAWRQTIEMNLNVAYSVAYAARPCLEASRGQLLLFAFSGVEKIQAWTSATAYGAAKAGVAILAKSLAVALGPKGVRVNAICPGYIDAERFAPDERAAIAATIPQGRLGRADEVAAVVRWLANESPQYMNGALLAVGGGWEP